MILLGIDIGGTGIKAGLVDVSTGLLTSERVRVDTPQPAVSATMALAVAGLADSFGYSGPIGIGFPAVVRDGRVFTANNIDETWIGQSARDIFSDATSREVTILNDADAAAVAEARFGVAKGVPGVVLMLTFGTGIGSGMLVDGQLIPNVELGVIELEGHRPAEVFFSAKARETDRPEPSRPRGARVREAGDTCRGRGTPRGSRPRHPEPQHSRDLPRLR